jgi:predicted PurR-regulated permease PerM
MENETKSPGLRVEITWKTIFKVLLGALLAYVAVKLWPLLQLLTVAILIAVPLYRIVSWVCERGWPRWVGLSLASITLIVAVAGFFGLLGPVLFHQAANLGRDLPKLKEQVAAHLPQSGPLHDAIEKATSAGATSGSQRLLEKGLSAVETTLGGIVALGLVIVFAIYLTADGPRALRWLIAFFPAEQRVRVSQGLAEIGDRIVAYTAGQFITSALCTGYVFVLLSILHVPMALLLGVVAGVFDIVPTIGFFLSVLPAMLVGLSVSPTTALSILILYAAYHQLENYFITPKVYGNKLRLSNLAVLLSITVAGMLTGVVGAIVVLPFVAAYPALERLWFAPKLEPDVVKEHEEQQRAA